MVSVKVCPTGYTFCMSIVVPTVLAHSRKALEESLARLDGLFDTVQLSVLDGRFIGPPAWPYAEARELAALGQGTPLPFLGHFKFEADLAVENPETVVGQWIDAGAERVLVHIEAARNIAGLIDMLEKNYGHEKGFAPDLLSFGVALNLETDAAVLDPYLDAIDFVQFMSAKQGQTFDRSVIRKITAFRKAHPEVAVQVSGKVTLQAAPELLAAGISRLCIGSALLKSSDVLEQLHKFEALADEYGRYV